MPTAGASEEDELGVRDFGQKVDLCQRIRDVLTNYPEGALLKVRPFVDLFRTHFP